jgi:hypothetical protein
MGQTQPVSDVSIAIDHHHEGAWATRNRAMSGITTTWTAFLDDDDEFLPHHVQFLLNRCEEHGLDMAWGWFEIPGGGDPFPHYRGRQYDINQPHIVPITYIVKTEILKDAVASCGGFCPDEIGSWDLQDMPIINAIHSLGAKMMAFPDTTWKWNHHLANTSGLPTRW